MTMRAAASSGLAVTFSTTTPSVCRSSGANGATVNLVKTGTCSVRASQPGNATYGAATPVTQSFTVSKASQRISFEPLVKKTLAQSPVTVRASASSGPTVTFSTTTSSVCRGSRSGRGAMITLLKVGTCTVRATQAGDAIYVAAKAVSRNFLVSQPAQG